jgi:hypothetical protein
MYCCIGTECKIAACPVTGVMRCMEKKCGKEVMKSAKYNRTLGATASCTLKLILNTIPEEDQETNHGMRGDAWFGSINTANEVGLGGHGGSSK